MVWTEAQPAVKGTAIAYGDQGFVSVGESGKIAQSPPTVRVRSGGSHDNPNTIFRSDDATAAQVGLPRYRVNTASLDVILEGTLFQFRTVGAPVIGRLTFLRAPEEGEHGMFGRGWRFHYESNIRVAGGQATLTKGSGYRLAFVSEDITPATPASPVLLTPPEGNFDQLFCHGTFWLYTEKSTRLVYRYEQPDPANPARLVSITDRDGDTITIAVDHATGFINSIADVGSAGTTRHIAFTYIGGRCTVITLATALTLSTFAAGAGLVNVFAGATDSKGEIPSSLPELVGSVGGATVNALRGGDKKSVKEGFKTGGQVGSIVDFGLNLALPVAGTTKLLNGANDTASLLSASTSLIDSAEAIIGTNSDSGTGDGTNTGNASDTPTLLAPADGAP